MKRNHYVSILAWYYNNNFEGAVITYLCGQMSFQRSLSETEYNKLMPKLNNNSYISHTFKKKKYHFSEHRWEGVYTC